MMFLIVRKETSYDVHENKVVMTNPQYSLGLFNASLDAEKLCVRMNNRIWKQKEYEFLSVQSQAYEEHQQALNKYEDDIVLGLEVEAPPSFVEITYNSYAREKDQLDNHYYVISLKVNE